MPNSPGIINPFSTSFPLSPTRQLSFQDYLLYSAAQIVELKEIPNRSKLTYDDDTTLKISSGDDHTISNYKGMINSTIRDYIEKKCQEFTKYERLIHSWCIDTVMLRVNTILDVNLLEKIGKGGFATVYRIGKDCALKVCKESEAIKVFDHPNLLKIERVFKCQSEKLLLIVMPFYELGHLKAHKLTLGQYWSLLLNLTIGLKHLHSQQVVHRDIKPQNILLASISRKDVHPVLSDFGLSRTFESCSVGAAGTRRFIAPELSGSNLKANEKSDIFSLGVTISVLILHSNPDKLEFKQNINPLTELLNRLMKFKPENRPTVDEIISECQKEISNLTEKDYDVIFKLTDDDIEIFDDMSFYSTDASTSNSLIRMAKEDPNIAKRICQIDDKVFLLDPMSISAPSNNSHTYKLELHEDGVVNAKKIVQIRCTPEARLAIQSIHLRVYNNKGSTTELLNVTKDLSFKHSNNGYSISNTLKKTLLSSVINKYKSEKGGERIDLYINNNNTPVDSAGYVGKNK